MICEERVNIDGIENTELNITYILTINILTKKLSLIKEMLLEKPIFKNISHTKSELDNEITSVAGKIMRLLPCLGCQELADSLQKEYLEIVTCMYKLFEDKSLEHLEIIENRFQNLNNFLYRTLFKLTGQNNIRVSLFRYALLNYLDIDTVFDIGANSGQFTERITSHGYNKTIHSFEPIPEMVLEAKKKLSHLNNWHIHNIALGDVTGENTFYVTPNYESSSFNPGMIYALDKNEQFRKTITSNITTLDKFIADEGISYKNAYIKIDVECFEKEVLQGCKDTLHNTTAIELESRYIYYGIKEHWLFTDFVNYLKDYDLYPIVFDNSFSAGILPANLASDVIFVKKSVIRELSWMNSIENVLVHK